MNTFTRILDCFALATVALQVVLLALPNHGSWLWFFLTAAFALVTWTVNANTRGVS